MHHVFSYLNLVPGQADLERLELSHERASEIIEERTASKIKSFLLMAQKPGMT
jgi:hypothetical protein